MRARAWIVSAFSIALGAWGGCASPAANSDAVCAPNVYVICRCPDSSEGSKQCAPDGKSFGACLPCDGSGNDSSGEADAAPAPSDAGFSPVDAGDPAGDAAGAAPLVDPACAGKLGVVAGSGAADDEFLYAAVFDGSAFQSFSSSGVPMRSPASVQATSASALVAFTSKDGWVVSTELASGAWRTPAQATGASADSAPALAPWGSAVRAVYHGTDGAYHATTWDPSGGWDGAIETVGSAPVPKGSAPGAASAGTPGFAGAVLVAGFTDDTGGIYRQEWRGTSWLGAPIQATAVIAAAMSPALVAMTGGAYDLLSAWVGSDGALHAALRATQDHGSAWTNPALVDPQAIPMEGPRLAALDGGRAIAVWRDAAKKPFFSLFDPAAMPNWSSPAPLLASSSITVASTPHVIRDTCGADAAAVFAQENGIVAVTRLKNGTWSKPAVIPGLTKLTYAALAETP